ncbi:MAG: SUMF1/EgtB/PvdO family nonheme iron enzyme [Planctomycetota bacterium]
MSREKWDEIEAFRKRFWADVQANAVRERADYVREFPGLESEIDAELSNLARSLELGRRQAASGDIPPTVAAPSVGQADAVDREGRIGRYVLEKELGRGGQGRVYLARDPEIGLEVALKVLSLGQAMSTQAKLRFKGEAEKAAKLNHPNIARVHEWGEDQGVPFIAMEFVRGDTLAAHIHESARTAETGDEVSELRLSFGEASTGGGSATTEGKKKPAAEPNPSSTTAVDRRAILEIAELIESAARGLHEAHERGLVHRDIKPANLIVTRDRGLVILDFGLAHDDESDGPSLTMTGDVMGTPAYMSPEQLAAKRITVDRRSDVYSLGVTLFECLALRRPFEAPTREALFQEIVAREAPDLRKINRKVPTDLAVIVHHALEKHPDQRYQSALEMAEDLRRFREHEPIVARPVGPITRTWRWAQRKPATAGLLATVFVALAAIAVITSLNNRQLGRLNTDLEKTTKVAEANAEQARRSAEEARGNLLKANEESAAKDVALREKTEALGREQAAREAESKALAEKTSALSEYERMADTRRLANARAAAEAMWPVHPDLVPDLEAWQEKYAPLFLRLDGHRKALEALREKAPPYSEAARKRDFAAELARIAKLAGDLPTLRKQVAAEENAEKKKQGEEAAAKLETELAGLRETVQGRRSWDYGEDVDLQFRHDTLAKLVADLTAFTAEQGGVAASVANRLDRSRRIGKETLEDHAALWSETTARIASNPRYNGLNLAPQLGLIPLGPDPASDLEEFLDWRTHDWTENDGALPERGEEGRIAMTETRGLIFVLIPGGSYLMGAQRDPEKPNFDPEAGGDESPVREVVLAPYLISKYEMTQGQWSRFDGENPARYPSGFFVSALKNPVDLRHPVEQVSWDDCGRRLGRLGLLLPTEAQWERAARAGADPATRWTGTSDLAKLARFANINGSETKAVGFSNQQPGHEDGWIIHAPVGSFAANAFGLFDTTGNVWEWCRDAPAGYDVDPARGDGLRRSASRDRVYRGGSFNSPAVDARLADRRTLSPTIRYGHLGLRPSRGITTE